MHSNTHTHVHRYSHTHISVFKQKTKAKESHLLFFLLSFYSASSVSSRGDSDHYQYFINK